MATVETYVPGEQYADLDLGDVIDELAAAALLTIDPEEKGTGGGSGGNGGACSGGSGGCNGGSCGSGGTGGGSGRG